jgi:hypothetical protein
VRTRLFIICLILAAPLAAHCGKRVAEGGAASPQDVVAGLQQAEHAKDYGAALRFLAPEARRNEAAQQIAVLLLDIRVVDPDTITYMTLPADDVADRRRRRDALIAIIRPILTPLGLAQFIGEPPAGPEVTPAIERALERTDPIGVLVTIASVLPRVAVLAGHPPTETQVKFPMGPGQVTDYDVQGDQATARLGEVVVVFTRIDGRWYLMFPVM